MAGHVSGSIGHSDGDLLRIFSPVTAEVRLGMRVDAAALAAHYPVDPERLGAAKWIKRGLGVGPAIASMFGYRQCPLGTGSACKLRGGPTREACAISRSTIRPIMDGHTTEKSVR